MNRSRLLSLFARLPAWTPAAFLLTVIPALAYLPLASRLGLYADDWYLIYVGHTQGIQRFWDVFIIDRPLRAFLVGGFYAIFGANAPLYSYSAFVLRVLGGLALLWILRMLWPKQRLMTLAMAFLFVIYPGFLDQINAIDYQSHLAALCLALWSIALSVRAVTIPGRWRSAGLWLLSFLLALVYLGLMEYYGGLEAFRFLAIAILVARAPARWPQKARRALIAWLPYAAAPALFVFWRLVLFNNQRGATSIASMTAALGGSPLIRGAWMGVYLLQDMLNTVIFAWVVPVYQIAFRLRLRETLLALLLGLAAAVLTLLLFAQLRRRGEPEPAASAGWRQEALLLGLASCALALVPVVFGSRHITFPTFSRFTLTASVGGVIALVSFFSVINSVTYRRVLLFLGVLLAVMTHYGNAVNAAGQTATIRDFWWQVAWRAPGIQPETTLAASYPNVAIPEDYFVWSPANLIYYPQKKTESPIPLSLSAIVLNSDTVFNTLGQANAEVVDRRGILSTRDYGNLLVLSMPTEGSCLQVMDGARPEFSSAEQQDVMLISPVSKIDNLLVEGASPVPPGDVFGGEPAHGWCYTYEKAALARQRGDWQEVARLGDEALEKKQHPSDRVEWFPFLQAYAHLAHADRIRALAPILREDPYLSQQVCDGLKAGQGYYQGLPAETAASMRALFCR